MQVLFVSVLLLAVSSSFCSAQHWSYGLQPGGKREVENPVESFEAIAKELDRLGALQYFRCNGPCLPAILSGPKGALANLIEGENGKRVLELQKRNKEDRNGAFSNKYI